MVSLPVKVICQILETSDDNSYGDNVMIMMVMGGDNANMQVFGVLLQKSAVILAYHGQFLQRLIY